MTSTLRIVHTTGYRYTGKVTDSFNAIRMAPQYSDQQLIRERAISISPHPWSYSYIDYWGTQVTAFELHEPHEEMSVRVDTSLDVVRPQPAGTDMTIPEAAAFADRWNEYLVESRMTDPAEDLVARVAEIARASRTIDACGTAVGEMIHDEMTYETGSTDVTSTAARSWSAGKGVCQDMAHVMIGALRHLGIPARYVSGYILPDKDAPVGTPVVGESHAWVQWWDGTWHGYDPTNATVPGEMHVQVGVGREYGDVAPLQGMFMGEASSDMFVEVEMTRLR
ncbi:transglutaminase family protein [Brachybacterium sp. AOP25-B2-12]|uniref:transglutaminase family protein n=1 Tax=Brachybacterium sp. AOP25-B2-12 TaxID=3457710 RepID=UPI004034D0F6